MPKRNPNESERKSPPAAKRRADVASMENKKKQRARPVAAEDRVFSEVEGKPDMFIHSCSPDIINNAMTALNRKAKTLALKDIFLKNDNRDGILISAENYKIWKAALAKNKKKPRAKLVAAEDRVFSEVEGKPDMFMHSCSPDNINNAMKGLNRKAKTLALKDIFLKNDNRDGILVSAENYKIWKAALAENKKKPRAKLVAAEDRVFSEVEGKPDMFMHSCSPDNINNAMTGLNRKAKTLALKDIFLKNDNRDGILVSAENYMIWKAALAENKKKQKATGVAAEDRVFSEVEGKPDLLVHSCEPGKKCTDILSGLNKIARKLMMGNIFSKSKTGDGVKVSIHHYNTWKAALAERKKKPSATPVAAEDRVFSEVEGNPDMLVHSCEPGKCTTFCHA